MTRPACPRRRTLRSDRRGVAAVEFALVAPVMVVLLFGAIELGNAFRIQTKVNTATGQLAELIAGQQAVTAPAGNLKDMCTGAAMNLLPFPTGSFTADIVSGTNDHPSNRVANSTDSPTVQPYLDWENVTSCATQDPSPMGQYGAYALANTPSSMLTLSGAPGYSSGDFGMGYSVIVVQATYTYANVLPLFLGRSITFSAVAVARPRQNSTIKCTNTAGTAACPALQ